MDDIYGAGGPGPSAADELLHLLADGDVPGADAHLAALDTRALVFTGAALTAAARAESRRLPPAQRAQASARQVRLGLLRDANRTDPEGLRVWLHRAAEEVLFLRALPVAAVPARPADRPADRPVAQPVAQPVAGTPAASGDEEAVSGGGCYRPPATR